jgi:hypothetical protein
VPSGDVEELFHGLGLVTAELVHKGSTVCAGVERRDDVSVADLGEFITFFGRSAECIPAGIPPAFAGNPSDPRDCQAVRTCLESCW